MNTLNIVLAVFTVILVSCEPDLANREGEEPITRDEGICVDTAGAICFFYETLDIDGKPKTAFKEGENFILSFRISNNTNQDIVVHDLPIFTPGYMDIFQSDGKQVASLRVNYTLQGGTGVFKHDNSSVNIQYYQDSTDTQRTIIIDGVTSYLNEPSEAQSHLTPGRYFSAFTEKFTIYLGSQERKIEKEITLKAAFTVQKP